MARRRWSLMASQMGCGLAVALGMTACGEGARETTAVTTNPQSFTNIRAVFIAAAQSSASVEYDVIPRGYGRLHAPNPSQGFFTELDSEGVHVVRSRGQAHGGATLSFVAYGCVGTSEAPARARPDASGNRVAYRRGDVEEWYVNGPLGLEQGFTLSMPPPCTEAGGRGVELEVRVDGDLRPAFTAGGNAIALVDHDGVPRLRYGDVYAYDNAGKPIPVRIEMRDTRIALLVDDAAAEYPVVVDPLIVTLESQLFPEDPGHGDIFGHAVAIDAETVLVGASNANTPCGAAAGKVYVFTRAGQAFTQEATLSAGDCTGTDYFGYSVALRGDTALVGAPFHTTPAGYNAGAAYVFTRNGGVWSQQSQLTPDDAGPYEHFGFSVALDGDTALIGAGPGSGAEEPLLNGGSAYAFLRDGQTWKQQAKLTGADVSVGDGFGTAVALDGDTAVIGAKGHNVTQFNNEGAAYVFVRSGGPWAQQAKLTAGDGAKGDRFGEVVAVHGDAALVGAKQANGIADDTGAVYAFARSGDAWSERQKLVAGDPMAFDRFGAAIAFQGPLAVIGAERDEPVAGVKAGAAYVFQQVGGTWMEHVKLASPTPAQWDYFGGRIAMSGGTVVVGAYATDGPAGEDSGTAFVFELDSTASAAGELCFGPSDCSTGFCADGVCCDTMCGGDPSDCEACSVSAGAAVDGTCGPVAPGKVCRNAASPCDAAETCDGNAVACPADGFAPDGAPCPTGTCLAGMCTESDAGAAGGSGGGGSGSGGGSGGGGGSGNRDPVAVGGCGCQTPSSMPGHPTLILFTLGLLGALRRRFQRIGE